MALTQVKTLGIADDAVTQDKVANDAVDITEIKSGTDGELITYDASGNPAKVGAGTSGHFLKSQGAGNVPVFAAVPAGGATINNATENEIVTVASTTTQLDAEANLTFDGSTTFTQTSSSDLHMKLISGTSGYSRICLGDSGDDDIGEILYNNANNQLGIKTNAAERLLINNAGDVTVSTGDLIIGTSGKGISFAATSAPNQGSGSSEILKDYEEGTWTPQIRFGNGAPSGVTYSGSNNGGVYTKIGRMIMCIGEINLTSKGTSTGYFAITGFPYNEGNYGGNLAKAHSSIGHYYNMANWERWFGLDMFSNDDVAIFRGGNNANTNNDRNNSDVTDTTNLQFAVTYFTDE